MYVGRIQVKAYLVYVLLYNWKEIELFAWNLDFAESASLRLAWTHSIGNDVYVQHGRTYILSWNYLHCYIYQNPKGFIIRTLYQNHVTKTRLNYLTNPYIFCRLYTVRVQYKNSALKSLSGHCKRECSFPLNYEKILYHTNVNCT